MRRLWDLAAVRFLRELVGVYFDCHVSRSAAELAYFFTLSFFPALICVNAFLGLLHLDVDLVLEAAADLVPREILPLLGEYITYINTNQSAPLLVAGVSMVLFSASAAFRALMNIMADIYGRPTYRGLGQVVASVLFSLLFQITVYPSIAVVFTGSHFFQLLEERFSWLAWAASRWRGLRFWLLFFVVMVLVLLVYRMSAPRGEPRPPLLTGSVLASAALVIASMLFSWFIGLSSRYSLIYGSLASLVVLLVWLYLCGNILILGNVFNFVWYRHRQARRAG